MADFPPAVKLDSNVDDLLSLANARELGLVAWPANAVLIGPLSGANAIPTVRVLDTSADFRLYGKAIGLASGAALP